MRRSFVVCGPESTGNHLLTRIFLDSGCKGSLRSRQNLVKMVAKGVAPLVWRGSLPRGTKGYYDVSDVVRILRSRGYQVDVIVPVRDYSAVTRSQVKRHAPPNIKESTRNIKKAYSHIVRHLFKSVDDPRVSIIPVAYESLVLNSKCALVGLSEVLEFKLKNETLVRNANDKWHQKILKNI